MEKKKIHLKTSKARKWSGVNKVIIIIVCAVILFILVPPFINIIVNTEAFIFPSFFGFITEQNREAWISFFGAIIGGAITLIGVAWTIFDQNKKRKDEIKDLDKPILVASGCTYEKINEIKDSIHSKVFQCELEYKNVGKGILFKPRIFNIDYKIDGKKLGKLNPSFSICNYLDIGDTSANTINILFHSNDLDEMWKMLEGRGNTLQMQIVMYVGGKDMYGRDSVTRIDYKTSLSFFAGNKIELPLHGGKITSIVISDKNESMNIVMASNPTYDVIYNVQDI